MYLSFPGSNSTLQNVLVLDPILVASFDRNTYGILQDELEYY